MQIGRNWGRRSVINDLISVSPQAAAAPSSLTNGSSFFIISNDPPPNERTGRNLQTMTKLTFSFWWPGSFQAKPFIFTDDLSLKWNLGIQKVIEVVGCTMRIKGKSSATLVTLSERCVVAPATYWSTIIFCLLTSDWSDTPKSAFFSSMYSSSSTSRLSFAGMCRH